MKLKNIYKKLKQYYLIILIGLCFLIAIVTIFISYSNVNNANIDNEYIEIYKKHNIYDSINDVTLKREVYGKYLERIETSYKSGLIDFKNKRYFESENDFLSVISEYYYFNNISNNTLPENYSILNSFIMLSEIYSYDAIFKRDGRDALEMSLFFANQAVKYNDKSITAKITLARAMQNIAIAKYYGKNNISIYDLSMSERSEIEKSLIIMHNIENNIDDKYKELLYLNLGKGYNYLSDYDSAVKYIKKAFESSGKKDYLYYLFWIYVDKAEYIKKQKKDINDYEFVSAIDNVISQYNVLVDAKAVNSKVEKQMEYIRKNEIKK